MLNLITITVCLHLLYHRIRFMKNTNNKGKQRTVPLFAQSELRLLLYSAFCSIIGIVA